MEELRKQLSDLINNCGLPAECIYYIYKDVFRDLQAQYDAILKSRKQAAEEQPAPQDLEEVNE